MSAIPEDLRYVKSHEWVKAMPDGSVRVGITDYAQSSLGDMVFVETPESGRTVAAGESCAVVESVKAASDVYAPLSGSVLAVNQRLAEQPELLNSDPYGEGWLWAMKPDDSAALNDLLDAAAYRAVVDAA